MKKFNLNVTSIFPDHINTDDIIPGWTLQESTDSKFFGQHAFSNYDPDFVFRSSNFKTNLVVAGENFGAGSSREQAVYALQENNVVAIVAKSFSEIFYRNAQNNGLILLEFSEIDVFKLGDQVTLDLDALTIHHNRKTHELEMEEKDKDTFTLGGRTVSVKNYLSDLFKGSVKRKSHFSEAQVKSSRPKTIVEKILSNHVHEEVHSGDRLDHIPVDVLYVNDAFGPAVIKEYVKRFEEIYQEHNMEPHVYDKSNVYFIADHDAPPSTVMSSDGIDSMREFAKDYGFKFYKPGDGIEHVILLEDGAITPGSFVLGTDSHTCTNGAMNSLAFGIGTTEAAYVMATGHLHDFVVPETIRINLEGKLQKGVYAKDVILYILGIIGVQGASKKVLEFGGNGLSSLSIDARTTIANMAVEMSARTAVFEFDEVISKFSNENNISEYIEVNPDEGCSYKSVLTVNMNDVKPCVAFPHKPDNVTFISNIDSYMLESQKTDSESFPAIYDLTITNGFLGACTNGKYEDFVEASKIIKGNRVKENVDLVVIPASRKIYNRLLKEGILGIFAEAGANIESSTCGPCYGKHKGLLSSGGQMISSSNRNFMGRMGSKKGKIFLASPATVVASVIEGKIVDPSKYL